MAKIKVENELTEEIKICKGVRQGCVLSPLLFNVYSEAICQEALAEHNAGITINGEVINNIRYADGTLIMADNATELQQLLENVNSCSNKYGLKVKSQKDEISGVNKKAESDC